MIGFEGQAPVVQYMPNKHHCFSFKLFCLCESDTDYTVNFSIYEGKRNTANKHGISHDVCIQLMGPLLWDITWYTAVPLTEALLSGSVWKTVLVTEGNQSDVTEISTKL